MKAYDINVFRYYVPFLCLSIIQIVLHSQITVGDFLYKKTRDISPWFYFHA